MFLPLIVGIMARRYVDSENEQHILYVRAFFAIGKLLEVHFGINAATLLCPVMLTPRYLSQIALCAFIYYKIMAKGDDGKRIKCTEKDLQPPNPFGDVSLASRTLSRSVRDPG
jgi:hypothetical protein